MTGTVTPREVPPSLEFHAPDCPICGQETNPVDDFFDCESCECSWDRRGDFHEWDDPMASQCEATIQPYVDNEYVVDTPSKYKVFRCVLNGGHYEEGVEYPIKHAHPDYFTGGFRSKDWR